MVRELRLGIRTVAEQHLFTKGQRSDHSQVDPITVDYGMQFDVPLQGRKDPPFIFTSVGFAAVLSQAKPAVVGGPTAQRTKAQLLLVSDAVQRYVLLQVRAEDLKSIERRAALVLGQAIRAGT